MSGVTGPSSGSTAPIRSDFTMEDSIQKGVALTNKYNSDIQEKLHPGFWRSAYEAVPIVGGKAKNDREFQIETLKNANQLIARIFESMSKAFEKMAGR